MENNSGDDRQIKLLYEHFLRHPHISTDSRNINSGDVFFALKGENFDGNEFVPAALEKGASLVVFDSVKMKSMPEEDGSSACQSSYQAPAGSAIRRSP